MDQGWGSIHKEKNLFPVKLPLEKLLFVISCCIIFEFSGSMRGWNTPTSPTLEVENKWESNDAMWAMIDAMIILIDTKRTDDFLESI